MPRPRRSTKKAPVIESSSDSEDEIPTKKIKVSPKDVQDSIEKTTKEIDDDSSSESDIENYLQPINKLDFSSEFFNLKKDEAELDKSEKNILIKNLSDSESESDHQSSKSDVDSTNKNGIEDSIEAPKLNFQQLEEFTRKIEEAKEQVKKYNARNKTREINVDISNMLAAGESKQLTLENIKAEDLHSSDFQTTDDEWEEVKIKDEKPLVPKKGIEIRIGEMPDHCKKKKGTDLLSAMKRRLNRIRKENQVYVHKVHLLCWIAHGKFVNSVINDSGILGTALSLLPSDKCYPSDRLDLSYLEQIVQWYKKAVILTEKRPSQELTLTNALKLQMKKKEAFDKKMYVLIFIAVLRALGVQCRMVLSFQVEPLRPPVSDLHSLSIKEVKKGKDHDKTTKIKKETKPNETELKNKQKSTNSAKTINDNTQSKSNIINKKEANSTQDKNNSKRDVNKESTTKKIAPQKSIESTNKTSKTVKATSQSSSRKRGESEQIDKKQDSSINTRTNVESKKRAITPNLKERKTTTEESNSNNKDNKKLESKSSRSKSTSVVGETVQESRKTRSQSTKSTGKRTGNKETKEKVPQLDGANDGQELKQKSSERPNLQKLKRKSTTATCSVKNHPKRLQEGSNNENEFSSSTLKKSPGKKPNLSKLKNSGTQLDVKNDIIHLIKGRIAEQKHVDRKRLIKKRKPQYIDSDSDSDYMPEPIKKKHHDSDSDMEYFVPKPKVKKRVSVKRLGPGHPILSDCDDESKKKKKKGNDFWLEVFLENEEKWITVDVIRGQVHCVNELYMRATHPVSYVIAWNNDDTIKDVTRRYCKNFNTVTRKLRIDAKWWEEAIKPFLEKSTARSREEDGDLNRQQLDQPLPKIISEYKNHPLYVLQRHLLKFEALYPPDIVPLGYVRCEPVYPRNSVYVCKSREIWLKDAKVVKPGENPYKIVKARPKYDKLSNTVITDQLLEIFGEWQTTDYDPPTAENGIVPRNAFGNVELFKQCMLPKRTVHLTLPGLNKVCRKLNIDCASAIVGFDFHGGWSHPVYDGFVICEEFTDQVIAAWEMDREEMEKKETEKIEKRVYTNWKKLIKGLLIRERLKARYDFGGETSNGKEKKKAKVPTKKSAKPIPSDSESE